MATEFNYVVNVDTTRVMGAMAEVRSQVGMAFGAPGGGGPAPGGGGFVAGAASAGYGMMERGFGRGMDAMFGTHTDPGIANNPHYGMIQATTNLQQERQIREGGLQAAATMRPPGVSGYEYAIGVQENAAERRVESNYQAFSAGRAALTSGAAGMGAGELAWLGIGAPVGGAIGGSLAKRWGMSAGAGKMIGGMAGGLLAFSLADEYVGGRIRDHYAEVEQTRGTVTELGNIAGAGRGLSRTERVGLGKAAFEAAGELKMDVNQMGDTLAIARQTGLLPESTNPTEAKQKFRELARAIDEGAQMLHSSLGSAAQVISGMSKRGYSAQDGVLQFIGEQATPGLAAMNAFGAQGSQIAQANFLSGKQGFDLFTGGVRAAAGADVDPAVLKMMGGKFGAGAMIAQTQMSAAMSPMGDMQLMAAQGGGALGGYYDMAGAALSAASEGGDIIGNMLRFDATKDQIRRGVGSKGLRTMAMQQINMQAEVLMDVAPSLSQKQAQVSAAMQLHGMTGDQARMYVQGGSGRMGGAGVSGYGKAAQMEAYQTMMLGRAGESADIDTSTGGGYSGFNWGNVKKGAMGGAVAGWATGFGAVGTGIVGGLGAMAYEGYKFGKENLDLMGGDGPGVFASAESKGMWEAERNAQRVDDAMAKVEERYGAIPFNREVAARVGSAPLRNAQLDVDQFGRGGRHMAGLAQMMGTPSIAGGGPGTTLTGGSYYNTRALRTSAKMMSEPARLTDKTFDLAYTIQQSGDWQQKKAGLKDGNTWVGQKRYQRARDAIGAGQGNERDYATINQGNAQLLAELGNVDTKYAKRIRRLIGQNQFADKDVRGVVQAVFGGDRWTPKKLQAEIIGGIGFQGALTVEDKESFRDAQDWISTTGGSGAVGLSTGISAAGELTSDEWGALYEERYLPRGDDGVTPSDWRRDVESGRITIAADIDVNAAGGKRIPGETEFTKMNANDPRFAAAMRTRLHDRDRGDATEFSQRSARFALSLMDRKRRAQRTGVSNRDPSLPTVGAGVLREMWSRPDFRKAASAYGAGTGSRDDVLRIAERALLSRNSGESAEDVIQVLEAPRRPADVAGARQKEMQATIAQYEAAQGTVTGWLASAAAQNDPARAQVMRDMAAGPELAKAMREATTPVSFFQEAAFGAFQAEDRGTTIDSEPGGKKKRRRREQTSERAVGFGAREEAMTTINKSLRRTHSMLKSLEGKISKMPEPSTPAATKPKKAPDLGWSW